MAGGASALCRQVWGRDSRARPGTGRPGHSPARSRPASAGASRRPSSAAGPGRPPARLPLPARQQGAVSNLCTLGKLAAADQHACNWHTLACSHVHDALLTSSFGPARRRQAAGAQRLEELSLTAKLRFPQHVSSKALQAEHSSSPERGRTMTAVTSCCSCTHCWRAASRKALSLTAKLRSPWHVSSGSSSRATLVGPASSAGCALAARGVAAAAGGVCSCVRAGRDWMLRRALPLGGGGGGGGAALPLAAAARHGQGEPARRG